MAGRRCLYLAVLALCAGFYVAYDQWLAWFLLILVLALPWFSLLLSLPAMIRFRAEPSGPEKLEMGQEGQLWLLGSCPLPMPPFRGRLRLQDLLTGKQWYYQEPEDLSTAHCGGIAMAAEKIRICDYLGLFAFPAKSTGKRVLLVRPKPVKIPRLRLPGQYVPKAWRPKTGTWGENHELRLYRPGDSMNQIHWKLSAKTGKLMIRQPMEPVQGLLLVTANLRGTQQELDRLLGRLLWLGRMLLKQNLAFELRVLTGKGLLTFPIGEEDGLMQALDTLLCSPMAPEGDLRQQQYAADWYCHVGGDANEA